MSDIKELERRVRELERTRMTPSMVALIAILVGLGTTIAKLALGTNSGAIIARIEALEQKP